MNKEVMENRGRSVVSVGVVRECMSRERKERKDKRGTGKGYDCDA